MQKITQQEMILSSFQEAKKLENGLISKIKSSKGAVVDSSIKALLEKMEIMSKNHNKDIEKAEKELNIPLVVKKNVSQDSLDVLQDILKTLINLQAFYNENLVNIPNPYVRQLFTQMRDDVMRFISLLQIEIEALESRPSIPNNKILKKPGMS